MIHFSVLTHPNTIGKHFLMLDGKFTKHSVSNITQAEITIITLEHIRELPDIFKKLNTGQHLCAGIPKKPTITKCIHGQTDSFSCNRTNNDLPFPKKGGLMVIDADGLGYYPAIPLLTAYACVRTTSSSAMIYDTTGNELNGFTGSHTFYAVKDGRDIPRAIEVLSKWEVLGGRAQHKVSRSGSFLNRTCIDWALRSPSQPIYVHAVCGPGLIQHKQITYHDGIAVVDTKLVIPDLTPEQEAQYQAQLVADQIDLEPEMEWTRAQYEIDMVAKGVSLQTVKQALSTDRHRLDRDFIIHIAGGEVTVGEIIGNREKYHLMNCADPFEPDYGNKKTVAKIYTDQRQPMIASKAHGEMNYELIDDDVMYGIFGLEPLPPGVSPVPITDENRPALEQQREALPQISSSEVTLAPPVLDVPAIIIRQPMSGAEWNETYCTGKDRKPMSCVENLQRMLELYGIKISYDVITKEVSMFCLDKNAFSQGGDNRDGANYARIISLCEMNGLKTSSIDRYISMFMDWNQINPVIDWVNSKPWDGIDRISELFNTITLSSGQDREVAWMMFRKWFKGAIQIVQRQIKSLEFVLVLQAEEGGEGKTRWFETLCPDEWQTTGLMLDPKDKDTIKIGVSNWLVELGEIDSTFKRSDLKALMSFLSKPEDDIRLPYAKAYSKFARRTAFFGTVNPVDFLKDDSGDRRFLTIAVKSLNYEHDIDMQQFWAQVDQDDRVTSWLNNEEHKLVVESNKKFKQLNPIEEKTLEYFHQEPISPEMVKTTAVRILEIIGVNFTGYNCKMVLKACKTMGYDVKRTKRGNVITLPHFGL